MSGIISAHYKRVGLSFGFLFFILALCCPGVSTALEWTTSGANIYNANSGNVGIGITSPASKLHLRGGELRVDNVGAGWVKILRGYNTTYRSTIFQGAQGLEFGTADSDTHTPRLFINSSTGKVGIGTTSPNTLLHLYSTAASDIFERIQTSVDSYASYLNLKAGSGDGYILQQGIGAPGAWGGVGSLNLINAGNYPIVFFTSATERMRIANSGYVGIGTTSPTQLLHLESAGTPGIVLYSSFTGDSANRNWAIRPNHNVWGNLEILQSNAIGGNPVTAGTSRLVISPAGNVGIGSTTPNDQLDVTNSTSAAVMGINGVGNSYLRFSRSGSQDWQVGTDVITGTSGDFQFWNPSVGGVMSLKKSSGNVGIGTTNPQEQLHVTGNVRVDGNIAAKYQDVAEWVPSSLPVPAGTVLILDSEHSNHVMPSSHAYDTQVAGVVTETPGILLGEGGEGKVKVATTGRVKVKVDASQMPIRIGDLLVTSDKEGIAMRSEPIDFGGIRLHRPGTILGKALESLSEGKGEILVLLTLQ